MKQTIDRISRVFIVVMLAGFASSCEKQPPLLTGGGGSPEELIQLALDRLAAKDEASLDSLTITRFEHDSLLIPEMPIGKAPKELTDLNMVM